ncbi:MAG: hypothetical protein H0W74_03730 [Sphingosinicella sp.]|nr:hypothetical protein [Sphingosinicella sp.]
MSIRATLNKTLSRAPSGLSSSAPGASSRAIAAAPAWHWWRTLSPTAALKRLW